jgi:hypothetical protein
MIAISLDLQYFKQSPIPVLQVTTTYYFSDCKLNVVFRRDDHVMLVTAEAPSSSSLPSLCVTACRWLCISTVTTTGDDKELTRTSGAEAADERLSAFPSSTASGSVSGIETCFC